MDIDQARVCNQSEPEFFVDAEKHRQTKLAETQPLLQLVDLRTMVITKVEQV